MLEFIKSNKEMSLSHWRFRLLHWSFNRKQGRVSDLPYYLYTHYCPLFHLTNLLILIFPFILFCKICKYIFLFVINIVDYIGNKINILISKNKLRTERKLKEYKKTKEYRLYKLRCLIQKRLSNYETISNNTIERWSEDLEFDIEFIKNIVQEEKECFDKAQYIIKKKEQVKVEREKLSEARKIALRNRITFWVNFSRGFIKLALNIFYLVLACFVLYLLLLSVPYILIVLGYIYDGIVWAINFVLSISILEVLGAIWYVIKIAISAILISLVGYKTWQFLPSWKEDVVSVPFEIAQKVFVSIGDYIVSCYIKVCEFIEIFYEENCPPITLIKEEE